MAEMTGASAHRERGWILARQGWKELAEKEYRLALGEDPHDFAAHGLLALLLAPQEERRAEALEAARTGVGLAPDEPFPHYVEARVHLEAERWDESERSIREAIAIDPDDPDFHVTLAAVQLERRRWQEALDAADAALAIDAGHVGAANLRGTALLYLGRRDEAGDALHGALSRDPENSHTHANQGWSLLHRGDRQGALEHFREALRLDPESEWARDGLVEALKARNPVYAGMLSYFLWMERLEPRTRWIVILGAYFGARVLRVVSASNPGLEPWLTPILVAYGVFVLLTWISPQVFNLVLMLSRDGRYALSPEQTVAGRWMGGGVALVLASVASALLALAPWMWNAAFIFTLLLIPLAMVFRGPRGRPRRGMAVVTALLYLAGGGWAISEAAAASAVSGALFGLILLVVVASMWITNIRGK